MTGPDDAAEVVAEELVGLALDTGLAQVDETDPIVALVTWGITMLLGKLFKKIGKPGLRKTLPAVALVTAAGTRAGISVAQGEPLGLQTLVRAAGAAGVAVLGHSQARELFKGEKAKVSKPDSDAATATPVGPRKPSNQGPMTRSEKEK